MHESYSPRRAEGVPVRLVLLASAGAVGLVALVVLVLALGQRLDPLDRAARQQQLYREAVIAERLEPLDIALAGLWRAVPLLLLLGGAGVALGVAWRRWGSREAVHAHYVVALTKAQQQSVPATLHYAPHWSPRSNVEGMLPGADPVLPHALPTAPSIGELAASGWAPSRDRMLLGYTSDGPLYGSIDALLSTAIAGRPGQGKSTLLRGVYWQVRRIGGDVGILDPHGSILDDVQGAGARFVASTGSELDQAGALLVEELERRLEAYRRGRRDFSPLLVLADELPVLSLSSKPAVEAIGRIILEARKVGAYVLVSGQGLPADRMGGRLVRDALSSRFIFKTSADEARRCGLGGDAARLVLDLRPGVAILDGPCDPQPVAVPNCTAQDLAALVEVRARAPEPSAAPVEDTRPFGFRPELAGRSQEGTGKVQTDDSRTASGRAESLDPESTRIVSLFLGGMGIPQIVAEVYPEAGTSGRRYQDARARVEAVLRRVLGGTA